MKNDDYDLLVFKGLDNIPINGKWLPFDKNKDYKETLIEIVKLRIDLSGDYVISNDYKSFKRINLPKEAERKGEMTYEIEWKEDNFKLNEKEKALEEVKPRNISKEETKRIQARRTDI